MKKLVLATIVTSFIAGTALADNNTASLSNNSAGSFVNGGDEVTLELSGNIEKVCKMQFYNNNIAGTNQLATVMFKNDLEQQVAEVVVWCNDGTGKADVAVDAVNGQFVSDNVNGNSTSKIDYLFRFHNNTTLGDDKYFNLRQRQKFVENIWASTDGEAFNPEVIAKTPQIKKLYIKPIAINGWERSGNYSEEITLTISPTAL